VSLPPALGAVAVITAWQVWRCGAESPGSRIWAITALVIPLVSGAGLIGWYNFARFHSVSEFGVHDQLTGRNQHSGPASQLFSLRYILPGLIRYLFEPPTWSKVFPFLCNGNSGAMTRFDARLGFPDFYGFDGVVGLVWAQPFLIFSAVILVRAARRRAPLEQAEASDRQLEAWLTAALTTGGVLGFLPALAYSYSAIRYVMDAVPCLSVLAALGVFRILDVSRSRWPMVGIAALVLVQSVVGILLAMSGSLESFAAVNPGLYHEIVLFFSIR
jgi:hypothetical protein